MDVWGGNLRVTIITAVYNRKELLGCALNSVSKQIFRDFEHIIVNDGSTENLDGLVSHYMESTDYPVMYITKENGDIHTARNVAVLEARGEMLLNLDSDDEILPITLQRFLEAWDSIPDQEKAGYREVVAQCMDEKGNRCGEPFPNDINNLPWDEAWRACAQTKGEHFGFGVTKVRKENLFPEPEGITFVTESLLWEKLSREYRSFFINDMLRVYHQDADVSYTRSNKRSEQYVRNWLWNLSYMLNHPNIYRFTKKDRVKKIVQYMVYAHIIRGTDGGNIYSLNLNRDRAVSAAVYLPSYFLARWYKRKRM